MVYYRKLNELGYGMFYKHDYYKNDKKITKDEYFSYVRKRLKKSFYGRQANDFFFLRMPDKLKNHKNYTDKEIPVDWLLAPIVEYFWSEGIMTWNLDQGYRNYARGDKLEKGEIDDNIDAIIRFPYTKKALKIIENLKVKYEILTSESIKLISISFNQKKLPKIYKKLGIEIPDINKAFTGGLLGQDWKEDKINFKWVNTEDEFTELVEYPDFFKWKGSFVEED